MDNFGKIIHLGIISLLFEILHYLNPDSNNLIMSYVFIGLMLVQVIFWIKEDILNKNKEEEEKNGSS